jgi:hypothetical protein
MDGVRSIRSGVAPGFFFDTEVGPPAHRGPAIPIRENVRKSLSPIAGDRGQPQARSGRRECIHGSVRAGPKRSPSKRSESLCTVTRRRRCSGSPWPSACIVSNSGSRGFCCGIIGQRHGSLIHAERCGILPARPDLPPVSTVEGRPIRVPSSCPPVPCRRCGRRSLW